jgi:hypothetical protein
MVAPRDNAPACNTHTHTRCCNTRHITQSLLTSKTSPALENAPLRRQNSAARHAVVQLERKTGLCLIHFYKRCHDENFIMCNAECPGLVMFIAKNYLAAVNSLQGNSIYSRSIPNAISTTFEVRQEIHRAWIHWNITVVVINIILLYGIAATGMWIFLRYFCPLFCTVSRTNMHLWRNLTNLYTFFHRFVFTFFEESFCECVVLSDCIFTF